MRPAVRMAAPALAALLALALPAAAQEGGISFDEDALFSDEEVAVETVAESVEGAATASLLTTEAVRVGGSFTGKATASFTWDTPWDGDFDAAAPDDYGLAPELAALLFFDGRPTEDSRFYGSLKTSWPFTASGSVLDSSGEATGDSVQLPNIEVFELFADFSYNDALFMRFGKQTINWGVGYFFSPANIMNLETIDVENPTAQLEGPVALRVHYPVPGTQANLWAYAVFDDEDMKPEETAVAAKGEFVLGGWEFGAGGYRRKDEPARAMLTATGSVGKVGLFGEATVSRGSSKTWITDISLASPTFTTTGTDSESLFWKATAGASYTNSDYDITVMGQYLYDGEGYSSADREALIADARANETAIKAALAFAGLDADATFSSFVKGLIYGSGRHYAALTFVKSELFLEDLSFTVFALGNLSDFSGYVRPSLSYAFFDGLSLSVGVSFAFGPEDSEYVVLNDGPAMGLSASLTMGSGSF